MERLENAGLKLSNPNAFFVAFGFYAYAYVYLVFV